MDGLKQRVIGALVLISLAVIFVPMLFDEPHTERSSRTIEIPEEPPFPEVQQPPQIDTQAPSYRLEEPTELASDPAAPERAQPAPSEPAQTAPESQVAAESTAPQTTEPEQAQPEPAPAPQPAASQPAAAEAPQTEEYTRSLDGAWVVQLGSFGNADNARRLRDKVRELGYDSHLQKVEQGDTTFTRVFSGPFVDEAAAVKAKQELDAKFGVNGLVTSNQ